MCSAYLQNRRKFVATLGSATVIGLAGCTDGDTTDDDTTEEPSATGAEAAIEAFLTAQQEFDEEAVRAVIHSESPFSYPGADGAFPHEDELIINDVTEVSTEEYLGQVEDIDEENLPNAVAETEAEWDDRIAQIGASDYAFVRASTTVDGEDNQIYYFVVEDDGEWYLF